jgi:hypothetical protein
MPSNPTVEERPWIMDSSLENINHILEFHHEFMYKLFDVNCEQCGKSIEKAPSIIWIDSPTDTNHERPGYFCNDECIELWFNSPADNPCCG